MKTNSKAAAAILGALVLGLAGCRSDTGGGGASGGDRSNQAGTGTAADREGRGDVDPQAGTGGTTGGGTTGGDTMGGGGTTDGATAGGATTGAGGGSATATAGMTYTVASIDERSRTISLKPSGSKAAGSTGQASGSDVQAQSGRMESVSFDQFDRMVGGNVRAQDLKVGQTLQVTHGTTGNIERIQLQAR